MPSQCKAYGKNKCWLTPAHNSNYCSSCTEAKDYAFIDRRLKADYKTLPNTVEFMLYYSRKDTLQRYLRVLYDKDKPFLESYVKSIENTPVYGHLMMLLTTHADTSLCPIIRWMATNGLYPVGTVLPRNCLLCTSHLIHAGITDEVYYAITYPLTEPGSFDLARLIQKNIGNLALLASVADAILERSGMSTIYLDYMKLVCKYLKDQPRKLEFLEYLNTHPLLHKYHLEGADSKEKRALYLRFRKRKYIFFEELMAKTMHPSRVFQWCFSMDEIEGCHFHPYEFCSGKAPWDIHWYMGGT